MPSASSVLAHDLTAVVDAEGLRLRCAGKVDAGERPPWSKRKPRRLAFGSDTEAVFSL